MDKDQSIVDILGVADENQTIKPEYKFEEILNKYKKEKPIPRLTTLDKIAPMATGSFRT